MLDLQNPEIFRAALENLQVGVCVVDHDRRISYWNDAAEKITGYLRQDVLGRFCGDVLLIKYHENKIAICQEACPLLTAMREGKPRESHVYLHHKAGYAVPVSLRAAPIRDVRGHVIGATESFVERPRGTRGRPEAGLAADPTLDAVTQLPDYPYTESYLMERCNFAQQHAIPFALLCLQLEHFDGLTATHGLDAAEAILNVVAHTLRNALDPLDFVGRWSEDQFIVVITNCDGVDLLAIADRLQRLAQSSEIAWWGDQLSVTVSVGGTISKLDESLGVLLGRTGSALQQALAGAGNSCVLLDPAATP